MSNEDANVEPFISMLLAKNVLDESKVKKESTFIENMIKFLRVLNIPIVLVFFGKQEMFPDSSMYMIPETLPLNNITLLQRIWMFFLVAFIPAIVLIFNYTKIMKTRRYTNSICVWIAMFAIIVLFYARERF